MEIILNWMQLKTYQKFWDATKTVLKGNLIAQNANIRNIVESSPFNKLSFNLEKKKRRNKWNPE